jgi:cytoskeletal protein CcmA (bactofilin family)
MWKKEDAKPQHTPEVFNVPAGPASSSVGPASTQRESHRDTPAAAPVSSRATACISQGIRIKGEITGSEDLFVDGPVEGKVNLANGSLTVGPNGAVKADVIAREVIVRGRVEGKISGRERVQLWSTGTVVGEVQTERLAIEDGAVLRGKVEAGKKAEKSTDDRSTGVAMAAKSTSGSAATAGTATI